MTLPDLWSFLHTPLVELLGWTLLHVVWQGALVAAALAGALYVLRDHPPRVRYAVSCAALVGLLALPLGTGMVLSGALGPSAVGPSSSFAGAEPIPVRAVTAAAGGAESAVVPASSWQAWAASWMRPALPWVVLAWGLGVLVFAVRFGGGAWRVRRWRRDSAAVASEWQERLRRLAETMGVEASVGLRQSARVDGPMLAGWWRPVILVPAGFLSGLPPSQVEALLLHELAHVRRHDVLVGRLQAVVETLLFFHPATWWISTQVRQAREACCDDLVVRAGSDRRVYAQALTALAERAVSGTTAAWAPAAAGGSLLDRIRRLVAPTEAPSATGRRLSIVAAALLMVLVPAGLAACASQQSTTAASGTTNGAEPDDKREAPQNDVERQVLITKRDSGQRHVVIGPNRSGEADSLEKRIEKKVFVVRAGGQADTIEVPHPPKGMRGPLHPPTPPDSLERALLRRIKPDSLERAMEARFDPDSLERALLSRINPDSIERAVRLRFAPDSIATHVARIRHRADSMARRMAERFSGEHGADWHFRVGPDSAFAFEFDREEFDFDLDVDSLVRRHERHADSLHRHVERMRTRIEANRSEHLREQARRLREQAERLEERAEEMEERAAPPADSAEGDLGRLMEPSSRSLPDFAPSHSDAERSES